MKLAIVGPSGAGKDAAAEFLRERHAIAYWGPTSRVIAPHAAERLGLSEAEAYARRHEDRALWRAIGDDLREHDPAYLARETLRHGEIVVGVRARIEIEAVRREGLVDLIVWVDRPVPPDETLEYGVEQADLIVPNWWGLSELYGRLDRLVWAVGMV